MEKNETSPWSNPSQIQDILFKEIFPKLRRDDLLRTSVCKVNKAWRDIFTKNILWKSVLESELPFIDISNTEEYYQKFCATVKTFGKRLCEHTSADVATAIRVCPCVPADLKMENALDMFYTGYNNEFIAKINECNCHEKIPTKEFLQFPLICRQCFEKVAQEAEIYNRKGCPEAKLKWVHATWIHKELNLLEEILEAKPIPNSQDFIAITKNEPKKLVLLKINGDNIEQEDLAPCEGDSIQISNYGRFVAVYTRKGTQGFVYDLRDKKTTFNFERGNYYPNHSSFPVSFFTYENKEYLIAGKLWKRVDLYDPETGESLKERDVSNNHLEFFWCSLHVSPDQKQACSFGWVWHPIGILNNFSIENWMKDNIYAMEKAEMITDGYDWDYPLCWLDNETIALWGHSSCDSDGSSPMPVVRALSAKKGQPNSFPDLMVPLEEYPIIFDEFLFSLNPKGVQVVDVANSLILDIANKPVVEKVLCYDKQTKQVVSIKKDQPNVLVLSSIHYYDD
jgi:hypothetical protein